MTAIFSLSSFLHREDTKRSTYKISQMCVLLLNPFTWTTSPSPVSPASVRGAEMTVADWILALAAALRRRFLCLGVTLSTSGLLARKDKRPMKHATCSSIASSPVPPTPLPECSRWSMPARGKTNDLEIIHTTDRSCFSVFTF